MSTTAHAPLERHRRPTTSTDRPLRRHRRRGRSGPLCPRPRPRDRRSRRRPQRGRHRGVRRRHRDRPFGDARRLGRSRRRTALVQGGALWGDVDHETQAHGLATTGGIVSHTGVGGLSLGGGIGWLMRKHGLTVDNLVEAEVVTADGEIIRASATDHPDLFWALRGGGGNFGVVSSFRFALHPVGPTVMAGPVFWAAEDTTDVLRFYREFVTDAPDELGNVIRLGTIPPLPVSSRRSTSGRPSPWPAATPGPSRTVSVPSVRSASSGRRSSISSDRRSYVDHQRGIDDTVPHGWHYYWKATNLTGLSDDVIDIVAEHAYRRHLPEVVRGDVPSGWRNRPSPADATAYPGRDVEHNIVIEAAWLPEQDDTLEGGRDRVGPNILRRPAAPPCRRLRELPRLRRRREPRPRGLRRRHVSAARRSESQVRPPQRVPQQQEHPAGRPNRSRTASTRCAHLGVTARHVAHGTQRLVVRIRVEVPSCPVQARTVCVDGWWRGSAVCRGAGAAPGQRRRGARRHP